MKRVNYGVLILIASYLLGGAFVLRCLGLLTRNNVPGALLALSIGLVCYVGGNDLTPENWSKVYER